jgi:prophage antirepressor-like protein
MNSNTLALTFQNTQFDVIDRNGQPWLRGLQIASALGYKNPSADIANLYDRNEDEFNDSMTALIDLPDLNLQNASAGQMRKVRVFSLRGCHLLGMLAKTKIAKEFRKWVLDILDKEVGQPKPYALRDLPTQNLLPNALSEILSANLTPVKKMVMLTIMNKADKNGQFQMGILDLAHLCGIAKSTIVETVSSLESLGFLTITRTRHRTGGSLPNTYTIPERFRFSTGGAIEVKQHDWINQPVESTPQPAFSIPNNMVMISAERYREMEQSSLELQFADLKHIVEQSGGLVLMKCEVDRMKGVLKA